MKTREFRWAQIAVVAILLGMVSSSWAEAPVPSETPTAKKYVPLPLAARKEAYGKIDQENRDMIVQLLALVREVKDEPSQRVDGSRLCFAVRTLGLLRAEEATLPLLNMIDVEFPKFVSRPYAPKDPDVVLALARIGKAASKAAVDYLAKDRSSKRARMYVRVIFLVEGADVGKFMVQQAAAAERDPEKKARLTKAIALFADAEKPIP